jgi:UDP-glucose:(heptosyl)LPS alpha-1,3-glucosyltransferase
LKALPLVISNTQAGRRLLTERFRLAPERVVVIPNLLTLAPQAAPADLERERQRRCQGAADPTFVLLNVGQFRREKGQADLIRLVADWNPGGDWQLWLVGDGPMLEPCRRLARKLPRVRFLGYAADPSPFYAGADAAVLASRTEGLPNFLCEAQAWGLPAVAYDVGGVREAFAPGASGYAVPYGLEGLFREALSRLALDLPHRAVMADAARARAEGFDTARSAQAYLDRFRALLSQDSGPGGGERTG